MLVPGVAASDGELVRLAQLGDTNALGSLLARHMAAMTAVALSIVKFGPDAEDAVQEASLAALERIGDVRNADAAGAWLCAIVRNACRLQLRRARCLVPTEAMDGHSSADASPAMVLERHALRDWMWHSIGELPEPLQVTAMLRYFGSRPSYREIAAATGVPVSTVRNRLHKARAKLSAALLTTADRAHGDVDTLTAERHRDEQELFVAAGRGELSRFVAERWPRDIEVYVRSARQSGIKDLVVALESDLGFGMHPRAVRTIASSDITVWENEMSYHDNSESPFLVSKEWTLVHERKSQRLRLYPPHVPFSECLFAESVLARHRVPSLAGELGDSFCDRGCLILGKVVLRRQEHGRTQPECLLDRLPAPSIQHLVPGAPDDLRRVAPRLQSAVEERLLSRGKFEAPHDAQEGLAVVLALEQGEIGVDLGAADRPLVSHAGQAEHQPPGRSLHHRQPRRSDPRNNERTHGPGTAKSVDVHHGVEHGHREDAFRVPDGPLETDGTTRVMKQEMTFLNTQGINGFASPIGEPAPGVVEIGTAVGQPKARQVQRHAAQTTRSQLRNNLTEQE
jgi:RNA polymerase sigma-70 factor, ECF subfamily